MRMRREMGGPGVFFAGMRLSALVPRSILNRIELRGFAYGW